MVVGDAYDDEVTPSGTYRGATAGSTVEVIIIETGVGITATDSISVSAGDGAWASPLALSLSGPSEYTILARLQDSGLNILASASEVLTTLAPSISITDPTGTPAIGTASYESSGTFSWAPTGSSIVVSLYDSSDSLLDNETISPVAGDGTWTPGPLGSMANGTGYYFEAILRDASLSTIATSNQATFDVALPAVSITTPTGDPSIGVSSYVVEGGYVSAPSGGTVYVTVSDSSPAVVYSESIAVSGTGTWTSASITGLAEDDYTVTAVLRDAGLSTIATVADEDFTVALYAIEITTPDGDPVVTASSYQPAGTYANIPASSTVEITVKDSGGATVGTSSVAASGTASWTSGAITGLTDGDYTVDADIEDSGSSVLVSAVQEDFSVAIPALTNPKDLGGALHYYEASVGVTLSGSEVTSWADQVSDNDFTGGITKPTLSVADSDMNGQDTLVFGSHNAGNSGYLTLTRPWDRASTADGVEMYFIIKAAEDVASFVTDGGLHTFHDATSRYTLFPFTNGQTYSSGCTLTQLNFTHKQDDLQAYSNKSWDGRVEFFKNGVSLASLVSGGVVYNFNAAISGDKGQLGKGSSAALDRWFYGKIAALFVSDGELSVSDRSDLHAYFNATYGLSLPT